MVGVTILQYFCFLSLFCSSFVELAPGTFTQQIIVRSRSLRTHGDDDREHDYEHL